MVLNRPALFLRGVALCLFGISSIKKLRKLHAYNCPSGVVQKIFEFDGFTQQQYPPPQKKKREGLQKRNKSSDSRDNIEI